MKILQRISRSEDRVMSGISFVEKAQRMSIFAEETEFERVGNRDVARVNLARKYGIAASMFRSLRY